MQIKKVGVVGCGVMGSGIAQICAQSGYQVLALETDEEILNKELGSMKFALASRVKKGKLSQADMDNAVNRIIPTVNLKDLSDCDLVIEAVFEDMDLKKKVFTNLNNICAENTIFATNTSALSVIDMAAMTDRPDKVLGMHFFYPVPAMKLLELVKTLVTSDDTIEIAKEFGSSLGKATIIAPDIPGFIVNRLFAPFQFSAIRMLEAGIATVEDIDKAVTQGLANRNFSTFRFAGS